MILTKNCNEYCKYCDLKNKGYTAQSETDLDYIKWIINTAPADNLFIEVTGGEPGLITNLSDVIYFLKSSKKIKKTRMMSNGLVRITHGDLFKEVDFYNEHLVNKIVGKNIEKFYPLEFIYSDNARTVIVLDAGSTSSILKNFDYYKSIGLFNEENFWLKLFVNRTVGVINQHLTDSIKLYDKINTSQAMHCKYRLTNIDKEPQTICKHVSWLPAIDIVDKKILHCAYHNFTNRIEYECNSENLDKLINKTLFQNIDAPYCDTCYLYSDYSDCLSKNNKANTCNQ